jgi:hypothetical protein
MANDTTDRELLELAASAVGHKWSRKIAEERAAMGLIALWLLPDDGSLGSTAWNPLENDGDAFRLAVALSIKPKWMDGKAWAWAVGPVRAICRTVPLGGDPCAATRRAIVEAAAVAANQMQEAARA